MISRSHDIATALSEAMGHAGEFTTACAFDAARRQVASRLWQAVIVDAGAPPNISAYRLGRVLGSAYHGTHVVIWSANNRYGKLLSEALDGACLNWCAVDGDGDLGSLVERVRALPAS